jgi:molecular chaperone DnaK
MGNVHVGIDLGTSNSTLATYDGSQLVVVANSAGEPLTPSVVRVDGRGNVSVGRRAQRFLESDPGNTRAEFKRLMGSAEPLTFAASGKSLLPEELSAHVLTSLLADARDALGQAVRAAVISTPALFEVPQNHATTRAGKLAGLEEVVLIQEPVSSAIAAGWSATMQGLWLVFDLGGGTLDVSLLETRDGFLRVVGHTGDNYLGGRDFDGALVDWAVERLRAEAPGAELSRANPAARPALIQIKAACEQAKIELSRAARTSILLDGLEPPGVDAPLALELPIERAEYEALVEPLLGRSVAICLDLLKRHGYPSSSVERVVLVGGPTLTPVVRTRLSETFAGRLAEGIDPMTAVARGAALYAATAGLPAWRAEPPATAAGLPVQLEHPAVTSDLEPFVVGRFLVADGEEPPHSAWFERADGGFRPDPVAVSREGSFVAQLRLVAHRENVFRMGAQAAAGPVALRTPEFRIIHGVTVADSPLSRSLGVARSDDTVQRYFEKGTPLPARRTFVHQTVRGLYPGSAEDALRIPVVQGEFHRAHRNRLIGAIQIRGADVKRTIPAGARVEVTLHLDRSGQLHARADLPDTGDSIADIVQVSMPAATPEALEKELVQTEQRVADLRRRTLANDVPLLARDFERATFVLVEARKGLEAARGGDADAAQRSVRLLLDLNGELDAAEQTIHWPELEAEAQEMMQSGLSWVSAHGTPAEQQMFQQAMTQTQEGLRGRNAAQVDRQIAAMRSLRTTAYHRDPESPSHTFEWFLSRLSEASDIRRASELIQQGRAALKHRRLDELRGINRQLAPLFPGTAEQQRRSFGSGVS